MEEEKGESSAHDELMAIIDNASSAVETEFSRTQNSWMECFGSKIFQIETYLSLRSVKEFYSEEKYNLLMEKLEELKELHSSLKERYPDKTAQVPEKIKQQLFNHLLFFKG